MCDFIIPLEKRQSSFFHWNTIEPREKHACLHAYPPPPLFFFSARTRPQKPHTLVRTNVVARARALKSHARVKSGSFPEKETGVKPRPKQRAEDTRPDCCSAETTAAETTAAAAATAIGISPQQRLRRKIIM